MTWEETILYKGGSEKASSKRCHLHRNSDAVSKSKDLRGSVLWADRPVNIEHLEGGLMAER